MANLKAIRRRISSVKGTEKITKAMKMVSASKLRRAQESIEHARPYAYAIRTMIRRLVDESGYRHPLMEPRPEVKRVALLVLTSDRGLCGAFNSNILRHALAFHKANRSRYEDILLLCVGRKAQEFFRHRQIPISRSFLDVFTNLTYDKAEEIRIALTDLYLSGQVDEVHVVYNEFKSAISQKIVDELLFPIPSLDAEEAQGEGPAFTVGTAGHIYEPSRETILMDLVPRHINTQILRCILESVASEHGARMTAMDSASNNAAEMINKLTLLFNRTRQAVITNEIMEIVGGAEALKQ